MTIDNSDGSGQGKDTVYDEQKYQKVKPLFEAALAHLLTNDVRAAMAQILKILSEDYGFSPEQIRLMKPYVVHFIEEFLSNSEARENAIRSDYFESQLTLYDSKPESEDSTDNAAAEAAKRLASGLTYRLQHLVERENKVKANAAWETLPNMPARLIWEALDPGSAAFFVVYKLMHEARSVLPKIYRAIAWQLCSAQPERFRLVTYREQLWDVLSAVDYWPEDLKDIANIKSRIYQQVIEALKERGSTDWWSYSEEDRKSDADWISERLAKENALIKGFLALRSFQVAQQGALTAGNIIMQIPQDLDTLAGTIISQAKHNRLPPQDEIELRVAKLAYEFSEKKYWDISYNVSIPFDLFTLEKDQKLRVIALTRSKATMAQQEELRRRLIYLRFFLHYAFGEREPEDVIVALAFYADEGKKFDMWLPLKKPLFNSSELWSFTDFWHYVAGHEGGGKLVKKVTDQAAELLKAADLFSNLRDFVSDSSTRNQTDSGKSK